MKIEDLYFGVKIIDPNTHKLKDYNLFNSSRVRRAIATWRVMSEKERKMYTNPVMFCFGDVRRRVEWEMCVQEVFNASAPVMKHDVYDMYVKPNAALLMMMVDLISKREAKKYLRAYGV